MNIVGAFFIALVAITVSVTATGQESNEDLLRRINEEERLARLKEEAEQGDADAQNGLAWSYARGNGVPQDDAEAIKWWRKAAEQGHVTAQFMLEMYLSGSNIPQDDAEEVKWWRKFAKQGYAEAQVGLGWMYNQGTGVPQDYTEAVKWFRKAAEQGHAEAQFNLGGMYARGKGVSEDNTEAAKWYRKAAEQGHAGAQFILAVRYDNGDEGAVQNYAEAVRLWRKEVAEKGRPFLALLYDLLYVVVAPDFAEEVKWYRIVAEHGDAYAQYFLGRAYDEGRGVPQNKAEAVKWYRKAAEQEHVYAQRHLGWMYSQGNGVPQDYVDAAKWYRKAAKQGDAYAQNNLGVMYGEGEGVPQNDYESYIWFSLAAANGEEEAKKNRGIAEQYLFHAERSAAQREATRRFKAIRQRQAAEQENPGTVTAPRRIPSSSKIARYGAIITFAGDIEPGDAAKLQQHIESGGVTTLQFNSLGGNLAEAVIIGAMLRERLIATEVPAGSECYSACVVAFVGGVSRTIDGKVGIHSFYYEDFIGSGNFAAAEQDYEEVSGWLESYLNKMRIPTAFLDHMKRVPHDEIAILNAEERKAYFLEGVDPVYRQTHQSR